MKRIKSLILLFLILVNAVQVFSQEDSGFGQETFDAELENELKWIREEAEATVTGVGKYEQHLSDVPAMVSVLDLSDLSGQTKTNLPEMLRTVPGVTVYRNHGDSPWYRVSMRGLNDNFLSADTLITIDGVPFFHPHGGGADLSWLPIANIERVEVIKGTFSTLYGANAFGGVINIVTKKGKIRRTRNELKTRSTNKPGEKSSTAAAVQVSGGENIDKSSEKQRAVTGMLAHSGSAGPVSYHFSADMLRDNGYRQNWQVTPSFLGPQSRVALLDDELNQYRGRLSWLMDMPAGFSFSGFYTTDEKDILSMNDELDDKIFHSTFSFSRAPSEAYDYLLRVYYNRFDQFQDAEETFRFPENIPFPGAETIPQPFLYDLSAFTVGGEFQNRLRYSEKLRLVFGADFRRDTSELEVRYPDNDGVVKSFGYSRKSVKDYGVYAQAEYFWQDRFSITPGIRYDYDSKSGEFISGKLAGMWHISDTHSLYGVAGRGFRAPNFNERFIKIFGKTGTEDLTPETTWQFELGSKNRLFQNRLNWNFCAFYTLTDDYIDTDEKKFYRNTEGLTIYGAETELEWRISPMLKAFGAVTAIIGENDQTGKDIPIVPKHKWSAGISYDDSKQWAAGFTIRGEAHKMLGDLTKEGKYIRAESYQSADAFISRKWAVADTQVKLTLFAENLFDEHYVEAWPGAVSSEGGRSQGITLGLRTSLSF